MKYYLIKTKNNILVKDIELTEEELTQVAALIDSNPNKATIFDKEFAEKVWKVLE